MDLNADLGEGCAFDAQLFKIISSASIACGGHAGNEETMGESLALAKKNGVVTGAHPGFLDKNNFGRVLLDIDPKLVGAQVVRQIQTLSIIGEKVGQTISYVKLHGALYNWASADVEASRVIFSAIKWFNPALKILALDNSEQIVAARDVGLSTIAEAFADRAYSANGQLLSRTEFGAVFDSEDKAVAQALSIARDGKITAIDDSILSSNAQSICLHGDNEAALVLAQAVRRGLSDAGISIGAAI